MTDELSERWATVERLAAVPGPERTEANSSATECGGHDDWAGTILLTESFAHIGTSPACLGYAMTSDGLAWCGLCGWRMSARLRDAEGLPRARFAMAALARVGADGSSSSRGRPCSTTRTRRRGTSSRRIG